MKLPVPYYSQFVDVEDSFWMLRACGAASLKMVAEFHMSSGEDYGKEVPDIVTLCNEARDRGGYDMSNGWVHDYLITKAQELGLQAYRKEGLTDLSDIIASLDTGNPVIVSVEKRVLEQTRFHLLVLVGYNKNAEECGLDADILGNDSGSANGYKLQAKGCFYYHEPESTDKEKGKFRTCSEDVFMEYFRGKAIFISK